MVAGREGGTQKVFDQIMNDLAEVSGYTELREVPLIPFGHSAIDRKSVV